MSKSNYSKKVLRGGGKAAAWLFYIVIVFEILYMISPFALYYYSLYKVPLLILQSNKFTSFLTLNLLPHFVTQKSLAIFILNFISWPLIITGIALFIIGFVQIYYSKFMKKGAVSVGLYKVIRHPQYIALAIVGLGTTIYWPRFIVYIMYATMLFLYYFLAKQEEKICLEKYGDSYKKYLENTGRFLPKTIEDRLLKLPQIFPEKGLPRILAITGSYFIYITAIVTLGFAARSYALSRIQASYSKDKAVISLAKLEDERFNDAIRITDTDKNINEKLSLLCPGKLLVYICPSGWDIPELGIKGEAENYLSNLTNPGNHGNPSNFDRDLLLILFSKPVLNNSNAEYEDILKNTLSYDPYFEALIDLKTSRVISIKERKDRGKWDGIPVPVY